MKKQRERKDTQLKEDLNRTRDLLNTSEEAELRLPAGPLGGAIVPFLSPRFWNFLTDLLYGLRIYVNAVSASPLSLDSVLLIK